MAMPYMAGGSCLHIMRAAYPNGFEEPVIATVLKESLKALEYLHRHGHIHRDIKAGNILVDSNGSMKLGDFGVSACMFDTGDRQSTRNTSVGTPCWMAPKVIEQLHTSNEVFKPLGTVPQVERNVAAILTSIGLLKWKTCFLYYLV